MKLEDLARIKKEAQESLKLREEGRATKIVIAMGTCGIAAGARETLKAIMDEVGKRGRAEVVIAQTGCIGLCEQEPVVSVALPGQPEVTYGRVSAERARQIVAEHVVNGHIKGEWVIRTDQTR